MSDTAPHNTDAEKAVLGAVLLSPGAIATVADSLGSDDFYVPAHQEIFRAMLALSERGQPIDAVTLEAELRKMKKIGQSGGVVYFGDLQAQVPTAENVEHYARLVRDASVLRRLAAVAREVAAQAYTAQRDVPGFLDETQRRILDVTSARPRSPSIDARALMKRTMETLGQRADSPRSVTGIGTGFAALDRETGGWQPGELAIIGGRPGVGKTSLAVSLVLHATVEQRVPALVFSLEMTSTAVGERLVCSAASVDSLRARTGRMDASDWERAYEKANQIAEAPFVLDDNARTTIMQIRDRARRFRSDRRYFPGGNPDTAGLLIVDYLQLATLGRQAETRQLEVGEIARLLKATCKELGLAGVVLAQLNRGVDGRADQRPRLSDLRDSGEIEQHADTVLLLSRVQPKDPGTIIVEVAKQRNGPTGEFRLRFLPTFARFEVDFS